MELHEFIKSNMEPILKEWEKFARSLPPGAEMDVPALRDHAKEILEAMTEEMSQLQSTEHQEKKSKGGAENLLEVALANKHAGIRHQQEFNLNHVMAEYRALRASVIRLWTQASENINGDALYQQTRFNEAIDQFLHVAVEEYSALAEEKRERYLRVKESEERYRSLAELSPDAILVCLAGRFVFANPAAALLLDTRDEQEILGRSLFEVLEPQYHEAMQKLIAGLHDKGKSAHRLEYRWKKFDGTVMDVEISAGRVAWNGKDATQIIARNVSQRKRTEKALENANQHKDEFLATLAHELRNPLAPIQSGIEVLRLTGEMPSSTQRPLSLMERQMNHLIRLVDDLLDISRISRGKIPLRMEQVDVREAVRKAVEATEPYLCAAERRVFIDLPSEPLLVKGDAVRVAQIIENLLTNAGKHTEANGRIWVSASRKGQFVNVAVRDDGIGIDPEKLDSLFEMFMQIDAGQTGGLGIGLALVRKLVELHGGNITGSSEGLGLGSEFVVCLPLLQAGRNVALPAKEAEHIRLNALKVLVVDDNRDAAQSLDMLLQLLGAERCLAHDGHSALAQLEEFHPDLVLLDIGLPGMDGYEVARRMREQPEGKNISIIAVSGWGQEEDRRRSLQAGINEHLVKPIKLQSIESVVGSLKLK